MKYGFLFFMTSGVFGAQHDPDALVKLPSRFEMESRFLHANLEDYLYEFPEVLESAGVNATIYCLNALIVRTVIKYKRTKDSFSRYDFYHKKVAELFLKDDPAEFGRYKRLFCPPVKTSLESKSMLMFDESSSR
jgi:hypothetical protein